MNRNNGAVMVALRFGVLFLLASQIIGSPAYSAGPPDGFLALMYRQKETVEGKSSLSKSLFHFKLECRDGECRTTTTTLGCDGFYLVTQSGDTRSGTLKILKVTNETIELQETIEDATFRYSIAFSSGKPLHSTKESFNNIMSFRGVGRKWSPIFEKDLEWDLVPEMPTGMGLLGATVSFNCSLRVDGPMATNK